MLHHVTTNCLFLFRNLNTVLLRVSCLFISKTSLAVLICNRPLENIKRSRAYNLLWHLCFFKYEHTVALAIYDFKWFHIFNFFTNGKFKFCCLNYVKLTKNKTMSVTLYYKKKTNLWDSSKKRNLHDKIKEEFGNGKRGRNEGTRSFVSDDDRDG